MSTPTPPRPAALVVDDEPDIRELLVLTLGRLGLRVEAAPTIAEAKRLLAEDEFALCLTDMRLTDGTGLEMVEYVSRKHPHLPIAVITAYGSVDTAVASLKAGAFDFVSKPVDLAVLRKLVQSALKLSTERKGDIEEGVGRLQGDSNPIREVRKTVAKVARSQAPVTITGESGTGKELVARLIHEQGPRSGGPFVPVNCGAIPTELMESEFFGHAKGSFTGAHADKTGLFQVANGGTLFLDEVADLPVHMQVKLLRVIQEKSVRPIGARAEVSVDVRILSATHKDLAALVASGAFRQDLYYRINVIEVRVPALRERREDIPLLAARYLDRTAPDWGISRPTLSKEALDALIAYEFPGNVRELENILERAIALCEDGVIRPADLRLQTPHDVARAEGTAGATAGTSASGERSGSLSEYIDTIERETIVRTLQETRYNKTKAAEKLGITFRALRYKLKKLAID